MCSILVEEHVRFDKIKNLEMTWTRAELREMIDPVRLGAFSGSKVKSLLDLTDTGEAIYDLIFAYATSSPREIVQIIDAIFREHARHSGGDTDVLFRPKSRYSGGLTNTAPVAFADLYLTGYRPVGLCTPGGSIHKQ